MFSRCQVSLILVFLVGMQGEFAYCPDSFLCGLPRVLGDGDYCFYSPVASEADTQRWRNESGNAQETGPTSKLCSKQSLEHRI